MDISDKNKTNPEYLHFAVLPVSKLENLNAGNAMNVEKLEPGEIEETKEPIEEHFQLFVDNMTTALDNTLKVDELRGQRFQLSIENSVGEKTKDKEQEFLGAFIVQSNPSEEHHKCSAVHDETLELSDSTSREESPNVGSAPLFIIDTSGSKKLSTASVPSYQRAVNAYLDDDSKEFKKQNEEKKNEFSVKRRAKECFSCSDANHSIRESTKACDKARIKRNMTAKSLRRYHIDRNQNFGHLRPGEISNKLRSAMELKSGELPFFFYGMRKLGYPPGWLLDAKVVNSGISLFDSEGQAIDISDDEFTHKDKYDVSKIISFPGFNTDPGRNFFDDYKYHNVPPMNRRQMKEQFIKSLGDKAVEGYKCKRSKNFQSTSTIQSESNANCLDLSLIKIEEVNLNGEHTATFCHPSITLTSSDKNPSSSPPTSHPESPGREISQPPTLADLEQRKQKLLVEADVSENYSKLQKFESEPNDVNLSTLAKGSKCARSPSSSSVSLSTPISKGIDRCDIRESYMGTPLLKFSNFDKLPLGNNFKVGVSDVVNFENLPDSTGKYEQMKDVIHKVRGIISKLQNEE